MVFSKSISLPTPIIQTKTNLITSIEISIDRVILYESADISIIMKDANNTVIDTRKITMEGEDYSKWGADDNYIIEFITNTIQEQ